MIPVSSKQLDIRTELPLDFLQFSRAGCTNLPAARCGGRTERAIAPVPKRVEDVLVNTFAPFGFRDYGERDGQAPTMGQETFNLISSDTNLYFTGDAVQ